MFYNPYAIPFYITGMVMLAAAYRVWSHKPSRGATVLFFLVLCCAVYSFGYAMEISSTAPAAVFVWLRIQYSGLIFIPPLFLVFALVYSGRDNWLNGLVIGAIFLVPLFTLVLLYTNHHHGLIYQNVQIDLTGSFPQIFFERGNWHWVHNGVALAMAVLGTALFLLIWLGANRVYRRQISILVVASLFTWLGLIISLTRTFMRGIDFNPFIFSLGGLLLCLGLTRYRWFDLVPVARAELFEQLPDAALIVDARLRISDFNTAAKKYLEIDSTDLGQPAAQVLNKWPRVANKIKKAADRCHLEIVDGKASPPCWYRVDFLPLKDQNQVLRGQMIILRDITDRKIAEEMLNHLATTDELTGLWNRRYFMQSAKIEFKKARRYGHQFALIMLDIDHFKNINDSFGHTAGDETLCHLSSLIKARIRETDIFARLGGEEFGIILPGTALDSALILAENLRKIILEEPFDYESKSIFFTVSIGVTAFDQEMTEIGDILKTADRALYKAKEKGRNCTVKKIWKEEVEYNGIPGRKNT